MDMADYLKFKVGETIVSKSGSEILLILNVDSGTYKVYALREDLTGDGFRDIVKGKVLNLGISVVNIFFKHFSH
jgi:hypothetical protein